MVHMFSDTARAWQKELQDRGYEGRVVTKSSYNRIRRLSRTWRLILKHTKLEPGASFFEVGSGAGNQLIPLALNGYRCAGIDCSTEVLERFETLRGDVEQFAGRTIEIQVRQSDVLYYQSLETYDCVFNFGVAEHFLDDNERQIMVARMFEFCRPGGYVVSVVPNGIHPWRGLMRERGWGGYHVPEIDYNKDLLEAEMLRAGAERVHVLPHNILGYRLTNPKQYSIVRGALRIVSITTKLFPTMKMDLFYKHATTLIAIGQKQRSGNP